MNARFEFELVPAHMRHAHLAWIERHDIARNPAQSLGHLIFEAARRHQLHADADSEQRRAIVADPGIERIE